MSINKQLMRLIQCEYLRLEEETGVIRTGSKEIERQLQQLPAEQAIVELSLIHI